MSLLQSCNLPRAEVEDIANSIRKQISDVFGYKNGSDLRTIVAKLGGRIEYKEMCGWPLVWESIEVYGPHDFLIHLPQETTVMRDRYTIVHELAHYFLHSNQGEWPGVATLIMPRQIDDEANWFAGQFLMPKDEFEQAYQVCKHNLKAVADQFVVSVDAARRRKEALGLE